MYGERPNAVALQSDGKIVVVDTTAELSGEAQIAVIRYNPDGSLDRSFNGSGRVLYNNYYLSFATDVAIQEDGKIIVAGFRSEDENSYDVILLRYNSNGTLDTSFNGGEVVFDNNVSFDGVNTIASLALQNDGKIIVATYAFIPGTDAKNLLLLRYNPDGSLDKAFGIDGNGTVRYDHYVNVEANVDTDNIAGRRVKLTPDDNIAVLIQAFAFTAVLKYDMNGIFVSKSTPFCGQTGCAVEEPVGALPRGMEVQPDGKIVVVGEAGVSPFVLRYTVEGILDTTFGEGSGVVYFNYKDHFGYEDDPIRSSNARNVALQPDGSILIVGSCPMSHTINRVSDDMDIFLARYNAGGSLDSSFGVNGVVTFDGGWRDGNTYYGDFGEALAIQSDGKIVVVGSVRVYNDPADPNPAESHSDMVIMRFGDQPNPELPSIEVSPESHNYGEVEKGKNKAKQFTLSNIGQSDVAIDEIELTGDDNIDFAIDPGTCQNLTPIIMAGESCTITVSFVPGSEGMKAVTLRIVLNNPNARVVEGTPVEVSLQGTGIIVQVSYTLSVSTDGNGVGSVRSKPRGISCGVKTSECTGEFPAGKEVILYPVVEDEQTRFVGWSGACTGRKECKVMMDSAKEVKATFMADPTIIVCPQSKNFKEVRLGKMRAAFIFVKNGTKSGKVPLRITGITLTGSTSSFSIFKDECSTRDLQPKEVCMFGIVFDPDSPTLHAAEAQISSTDPVSPIKTVALSGKGVAPPPPKPPRPPRKK